MSITYDDAYGEAIMAAQTLLQKFKILSPSQINELLRLRGFSNQQRKYAVKSMIYRYSYGGHGYVKIKYDTPPNPQLEKAIEVYLALPGNKDGIIFTDSYPIQLSFFRDGIYSIVLADGDKTITTIKLFEMEKKLLSDQEYELEARTFFVVVEDKNIIPSLKMNGVPCTFIEAKFVQKNNSGNLKLADKMRFYRS